MICHVARQVARAVSLFSAVCCAVIANVAFAQSSPARQDMSHSHTITIASPASDAAVTDFVARAQAGTEQFRDRRAAIAAGYRRIGMDFPSMGEHWVNPGLVLSGKFDAARPAMLSYVMIEGRPVLAGVVYAIPLAAGEKPPPVPGGEGMWHEHNGSIDDESMLPEHGGELPALDHATNSGASGTRLAVLHVWIGVPNPAGLFAAENWALPFARLGVAPATPVPTGAARALSLDTGGGEYFSALATSAGGSPASISKVLGDAADAVAPIAARGRGLHGLSAPDIDALNAVWDLALHKLARDCGLPVAARLNGGAPLGHVPPT